MAPCEWACVRKLSSLCVACLLLQTRLACVGLGPPGSVGFLPNWSAQESAGLGVLAVCPCSDIFLMPIRFNACFLCCAILSRPVELRGDIACSNGLMHKIGPALHVLERPDAFRELRVGNLLPRDATNLQPGRCLCLPLRRAGRSAPALL